jgi:phosphorylcholine metabolism protein LicD
LNPREKAFVKAATLLDKAGIVWWLSDGSVLGCVREGRFLDSDHDIDLGAWSGDLPAMRKALENRGIGRVRRDIDSQLQVKSPGIKFDIHGYNRDGDVVWYPLGLKAEYRYQFPARLFDRFEWHEFYGRQVRTPCPSVDYLEAHYGPDWQTPKPVWDWRTDPTCLV